MVVVGFFLVTVLSSGKTAYTVSYSLLLAGLVLQGFISSHLLIICMYITDLPTWFLTIRSLIRLYPPYNFATSFYEISRLSSSHPLYTEYRWAPGEGYTWDHFFKRQEGWIEGHQYITPSLSDSLTFLCWDMVFFAVLTWVCDHVVESNRGVSEPIYFMFTRKYWGIGRNSIKKTARENIEMHEMSGDDVIEEKDKIKFLERTNEVAEGVRIIGLGKTYQKYPCGITSTNDVRALRDLYLSAEKDEVLTLLGHNGAGKSTLLSILSGTLAPSHGSAVICGNDIGDSMDSIRSHMGFCPQHSWLWDELTAEEHLYFFTRLKGFSAFESTKICRDILQEVELSDVAKARVGTFSGGMRRRMSIALAGIGNPDVILMDEPTTGLDPISRAQVWKLIQHLKRGKVVILTTHSMEEADALSDRIAVLVDGALKCIGSSLYLKNKYGTGYRVSLVSKDSSTLCEVVKSQVPAAQILDESADSLLVNLPKNDLPTLTRFFQSIEAGELSHLVSDWGISNTTLEEVFMRLTDKESLLG